MRLDVKIANDHPEQSRSVWKKLIEAGQVSVNGTVRSVAKSTVTDDDVIEVIAPVAPDHSESKLPILFEDDNVIVIDKPLGILSHSKGALNDEFTVAEFVRAKTSYKQDTNRPGIIHRLDRATSGIIICVKNDDTASYIAKQFSNRTVKKQYAAVTSGVPKEHEAFIQLPIGRNPSAPSTFRVDAVGKPAETYYTVVESTDRHALVRLNPKTGRTHQLRVHMAYIGTPIVGDIVYGTEKADRMFLHAETLELTLPGGDRRVFTSPIPSSFAKMVRI